MRHFPASLFLLLLAVLPASAATSIYTDDDMARLHQLVNTIYNATRGCDASMAIDTINRPYNDDQALEMAQYCLSADGKASRTVRDG